MCSNLSWAENYRKGVSKDWRSFYSLKRNISPIANLPTKLYAFIGYVVPVLTYASQVWYPSKLEFKALERVQKSATKWICSSRDDYRTRLNRLNILPISMYIELHDLFLLFVINGYYTINSSTIPDFISTETRQSKEFAVPKHRLRKCDKKFLNPATRLYNIVKNKRLTNLWARSFWRKCMTFFTDATMNLSLSAAGESCATVETVTPLNNLC